MIASVAPERHEAAEYYFRYIDAVPAGDIRTVLERQHAEFRGWLDALPDAVADVRYARGKWTVREVLSHVSDTERVLSFRAFWFARGFESPLPSFEEQTASSHAEASLTPWRRHVEEFSAVRSASVNLFRNLPEEAWLRRGIASGHPFSVRALAFLVAGHAAHHRAILRERYRV